MREKTKKYIKAISMVALPLGLMLVAGEGFAAGKLDGASGAAVATAKSWIENLCMLGAATLSATALYYGGVKNDMKSALNAGGVGVAAGISGTVIAPYFTLLM